MKLKSILIYLGLSIIILTLNACSKGVHIDEDLEIHFEQFKIEAEMRGIVFDNDVAQIEGYLQNIFDNGVIGACRRNEDNDKNPAVFIDEPYWKQATDLEREYVVFHELGHCFLFREHDDNADSTGACVSIMASGLGTCQEKYNSSTRDQLLDELFGK